MGMILFCSCGCRTQLLKFLKQSLGGGCRIICTDNSSIAPALYVADKHYVMPRVTDEHCISTILQICRENNVQTITTLVGPEIELLSKNRGLFLQYGILPPYPKRKAATCCFDKFGSHKYLTSKGICTVLTYNSVTSFEEGLKKGDISFPVLIRPISGNGDVGIRKVQLLEELREHSDEGEFIYIIQGFMDCDDRSTDVYTNITSYESVAAFSERKLGIKIGGASKTTSFKDKRLFDFTRGICKMLKLNGLVDMDSWYKDDEYYLSEVNPRFRGAYLHAYGTGVDFSKLIVNNMRGIRNQGTVGQYDEDVSMMIYDGVVIVDKRDLVKEKI